MILGHFNICLTAVKLPLLAAWCRGVLLNTSSILMVGLYYNNNDMSSSFLTYDSWLLSDKLHAKLSELIYVSVTGSSIGNSLFNIFWISFTLYFFIFGFNTIAAL